MEAIYEDWYLERFENIERLCELGIWVGDSVRWWREKYAPEVHVGLDFRPRPSAAPDGYTHIQGDQGSPASLLQLVDRGPFDLVVDDAAHSGPLAATSFRTLWPSVVPGGCYVIEDWQDSWLRGQEDLPDLVWQLVREVGMAHSVQPPAFRELAGGAQWGDLVRCEIRSGIAAFWKFDAPSG